MRCSPSDGGVLERSFQNLLLLSTQALTILKSLLLLFPFFSLFWGVASGREGRFSR